METKIYPSTAWYKNVIAFLLLCVSGYIVSSLAYIVEDTIKDAIWHSTFTSYRLMLGAVAFSGIVMLGIIAYGVTLMVTHLRNNGIKLKYNNRKWSDLHVLQRVDIILSIVAAPAFTLMLVMEASEYIGESNRDMGLATIFITFGLIAVIKIISLSNLSLWKTAQKHS
jgi:hypothetical protein